MADSRRAFTEGSVSAQQHPTFIATCHCNDCKKASGGATATFFGVSEDDFTLLSGKPKSFHYIAESGKGLDRAFCPDCGARLFTNNLASLPGTIFVTLGSLDRPELVKPMLEMFTKRRLKWEKPVCTDNLNPDVMVMKPAEERI